MEQWSSKALEVDNDLNLNIVNNSLMKFQNANFDAGSLVINNVHPNDPLLR